jgi:hypothetical protein
MENLYNPYDNGPIAPICRVKDNLGIWTGQKYEAFQVDYIEPIMRSSPFVIDILALTTLTNIPANNFIQAMLVPALQMNLNELFHARWYPLDDVEGALYQLSGMARNAMRGGQSRTSLQTMTVDPNLSSTTFWVLGSTSAKDAFIQAVNPNPVLVYSARFAYFGYRYMLTPLPTTSYNGIYPTVPANITYLPAQGR